MKSTFYAAVRSVTQQGSAEFYSADALATIMLFSELDAGYYAALLPRRGPHIASHSVCLSIRPVIVAIGNVFSSTASVTDVLFGTH